MELKQSCGGFEQVLSSGAVTTVSQFGAAILFLQDRRWDRKGAIFQTGRLKHPAESCIGFKMEGTKATDVESQVVWQTAVSCDSHLSSANWCSSKVAKRFTACRPMGGQLEFAKSHVKKS